MSILTIGEILVEIVATTKGDGFLEAQPLVGPFPSGAPAIFIDQVGKTGAACAIISRVGDDDFGRVNTLRLQADGVDISGIEVAPGESTGSAFVRYREDGSRAFVFNIVDAACGRLKPTPANEALIAQASHLHVMGTALAAPWLRDMVMTAARAIKAKGGTLSFDPNLRAEMLGRAGLQQALHDILALSDIFLPSGDEIFLFSQSRNLDAVLAELFAVGLKAIVHKKGDQGASLYHGGQSLHAAPHRVAELDPTGAGDAFGGAFIGYWLQGTAPALTLRLANAAGARAVTALGPMEGTSTRAELDAFLAVSSDLAKGDQP